jgi:hypothetical protein
VDAEPIPRLSLGGRVGIDFDVGVSVASDVLRRSRPEAAKGCLVIRDARRLLQQKHWPLVRY